MLGKRGLSPLAATALLIIFAISLGAVILSFGENIIDSTSQAPIVDGTKMCPSGCISEEIFTKENSPLIQNINSGKLTVE